MTAELSKKIENEIVIPHLKTITTELYSIYEELGKLPDFDKKKLQAINDYYLKLIYEIGEQHKNFIW